MVSRKERKRGRVVKKRSHKSRTFLIVCEGQTEKIYFERYNSKSLILDVRGIGYNSKSLVHATDVVVKSMAIDYDQVWCVFDEDSLKANFDNAIHKALEKGFRVAYSNQAFEIWFILHFSYRTAAMSRHDYAAYLDKHFMASFGQRYAKTQDYYDQLLDYREQAMARAKKLLQEYAQSPQGIRPHHDNPSTTVHELVAELLIGTI